MEKIKIKNARGQVYNVEKWALEKEKIEKKGSEFFGCQVIADPAVINCGEVFLVWRCRSCQPELKVEGFYFFGAEKFFRVEELDGPVVCCVPVTQVTAEFGDMKAEYVNQKLHFWK